MSGNPLRTLITIVMNVLVVLAIVVTVALVVRFFGVLAARPWGEAIVRVGDLLTLPAGVEAIKTPYGGAFDVDAALTVGAALVAEWLLSVIRGRI